MQNFSEFDNKKIFKEIEENGIISINIFNADDLIRSLNKSVTECLKTQSYKKLGGSIAGHLNFSFGQNNHKEIKEKLINKVLPIAKAYLKTDSCNVVIGGNVNLPGSINQHWHSDSNFDENWLIMNFLIDDFTNFNGATEYVEKTHKKYISYFDYLILRIKGKFKMKSLSGMKKGNIILRDSNLWHRGTKNNMNFPRAMLSISFYKSEVDKIFSAREQVGFYDNWFGNGRRWIEILYVFFPFIYSLKRVFMSLKFAKKKYSI